MTTREKINRMLEKAKVQKAITSGTYWNGYINALNELKLTVKPSERSITDEPS